MKQNIEFVTKVRINGVYYSEEELSPEEIKAAVQRSVDAALASMNYEKKNTLRFLRACFVYVKGSFQGPSARRKRIKHCQAVVLTRQGIGGPAARTMPLGSKAKRSK